MMRDLVRLLVLGSEKAANVARIIKSDSNLFQLLIEEKSGIQKNTRFVQDFKTLADVLIQESLRWEISKKFPEMRNSIYGEETNTFTNGLGETVTIKVQNVKDETVKLLTKIIGDENAAKILAEEIHKDIKLQENGGEDDALINQIPEEGLIQSYSDVGIWIDPIDATNEYIKGSSASSSDNLPGQLCKGGLPCVTVLIGAFNIKSGEPIAGVINQPFYKKSTASASADTYGWEGRVLWGTCHPLHSISNIPPPPPILIDKTIITSSTESDLIKSIFKKEQFQLISAAGAGYKLLAVILGFANAYVVSKSTTHYWDTCGPHAVLKAMGGGILNFKTKNEMVYGIDDEEAKNSHYANIGGLVAYRSKDDRKLVMECLKQ